MSASDRVNSPIIRLAPGGMPESDQRSQVLTLREAAAYLRISKAHLSNVIKGKVDGVPRLRHAEIGRRILIKREWAAEWLEKVAREWFQG